MYAKTVQWGVKCLVPHGDEAAMAKVKGVLDTGHGTVVSVSFTMLHPSDFAAIRAHFHIDEADFRQSLSSDELSGGQKAATSKSGSKFWRSSCNRFILKTINKQELDCVGACLAQYRKHLEQHPKSLLSHVLAAYRIRVGRKYKSLVVINNLFGGVEMSEVFDLKGTTENRLVKPHLLKTNGVGKDLNFKGRKITVKGSEVLKDALAKDAELLHSWGVLDYSLLVGIRTRHQNNNDGNNDGNVQGDSKGPNHVAKWEGTDCDYYIGIIDFLQQWTAKKVAAHTVKRFTLRLVHEIDTEPPGVYQRRFVSHMQRLVEECPAPS